MSLSDSQTDDVPVTLVNFNRSAVDEKTLVIANFMLANADRSGGSSKSSVSYMKLDAGALASGQVRGVYVSGTEDVFMRVDLHKTRSFPALTTGLRTPLASQAASGTYIVNDGPKQASVLLFDVLMGSPVIAVVNRQESINFHFTVGPVWIENGVFESMWPEGNGGEGDDTQLQFIRGYFLDANRLEFYLISPVTGLEGPMTATRGYPPYSGD